MLRRISALMLALALTFVFTGTALAARGGAPAVHELSGREWGAAVSGLATAGMMPYHEKGNGGGMPAAHNLSGAEWGAAVSELAQMGGIAANHP
jgi:hypothetical protein